MYMRHIMYYCKYCSFFLAKEISGYRDKNTHNSSHTRKYFEIHTKGYFEYRDMKFASKVNKHIAWCFEYRDEENPHTDHFFLSQKSLFCFEAKQVKLTFCFASKQNFVRFLFRIVHFEAKRAGTLLGILQECPFGISEGVPAYLLFWILWARFAMSS
jgi:ribosomal protein L44E